MRSRQSPSPPGQSGWRGRGPRLAAAVLALAVGTALPLSTGGSGVARAYPRAAANPTGQAQVRAAGAPLLDESFRQATAPEFSAVGPACLTGAPPTASPPGSGNHPVLGCPPAIGPVPPDNAAPEGFLRLTDAGHFQSAAVLYNHALPAGQGLDVTFDQYQYGSTTPANPADGISFFLVDGAASLTRPGSYGGSLGYAQIRQADNPGSPLLPGVDHGYLGLGLDVYGNFFGDGEERGNGCPQRAPARIAFPPPGPNMVTLRGPGNDVVGYCFLTATTSNLTTTGPWPSTLPGKLQGPTTVLPPGVTPAQAADILEESRRQVNVRITAGANPTITVAIDFNDGTGPHQVLSTPAPQPLPATYKFGFASSTGASTDVHLIRNVVVTTDAPLPQLNLVKQVRLPLPGDLAPGSQVPYDFVVTNSGNTEISNLVVNDPKVGPVSCPVTTLAPGRTITCTATYTVTAADAANGSIDNTAVATGTSNGDPVTSPPSSESVPLEKPPALQIEKNVVTPGPYTVGQTVTYSYTVRNTGGVQLTNIQVHDDHVTGITCQSTTLAPADSTGDTTTCTGTYTITPTDGTTGSVTNTATATGTTDGQTITSPETDLTIPVGTPHLTLTKQVVSSGPYHVGSTAAYSYTVTNTGSTVLHNVTVQDTRVAPVPCDATTLAPGATTTCHGTYTVTQADIDDCTRADSNATQCVIVNTARAGALDPQGHPIASDPADASITVPVPAPRLSLAKQVTSSGPFQVGSVVAYSYRVTNTGNLALNDLTVTDDHITGIVCDATTLAAGATTTCHGTYTVTRQDLVCDQPHPDGCHVINIAVAYATDQTGDQVVSEETTAVITVNQGAPALSLTKRADRPGPFSVGETVTYTYTAHNTGTTDLTGLTVTDDLIGNVSCTATRLAPGESTTCHGSYTITERDVEAGRVTNTARASGTDPEGRPVESPPVEVTVETVPGAPSLSITKQSDVSGSARAGDTVTYTYTVTNSGSTVLTDVAVSDDRVASVVCDTTTLNPGGSTTCRGTYVVTQEDARAGHVTNTVTASARTPNGESVKSRPVSLCITVSECPGKEGCGKPPHPSKPPHPGGPSEPPHGGGGHLPDTGATVTAAGLAAGGLVTVGGLLLHRARRRSNTDRSVE
ncbi:LPXTG cell wall anchor domain-containing protein [Kitasatospora sp. NPDC015120]|uniref:DUF7507 domain-containing protein n=1 Tax=Kitasatospora sp. NPDC015120 TaxID=3364023 RepID=UPI0036F4761F